MTEQTTPYVLDERNPVHTRRVVAFASPTRFIAKGLTKDDAGRLEIVAEADDIVSWKLDFSGFLDDGERITDVTVSGHAKARTYDETSVILTTNQASTCPSEVFVSVTFSSGERHTSRVIIRQPRAACSTAPHITQPRGTV